MAKQLYIILAAIIMISTGFIREFVFVNINEQLRYLWFQSEPSQMSEALSFLSTLTYTQMYYLKWVLTITFGIVFYLETILICKLMFDQWYKKEAGFLFLGLFILSGTIFTFYYVLIDKEQGYIIARYLMGMVQSPVPCMVLVPALFLKKRIQG